MQKLVCEKDMCNGCAACIDKCSKGAITLEDNLISFNAIIDSNKCINCNLCHNVCPNNTSLVFNKPISWYQGWASDAIEREKSSSGGFATVLSKEFIKNGGVVCSCCFKNGDFVFEVAKTTEDVDLFRGSKYVKSNPIGIYRKVNELIKDKKVLFIGLPCQVAAIKNYISKNYQDNLYTVDLICHGTPSSKILKKYLFEHKISIKNINSLSFRNNNNFILTIDGKYIYRHNIMDNYTMTFLKSINYTNNCYSCKFARTERVSDITIGDSWGSNLKDEAAKGISLVLCQTEKGNNLLKDLPFVLKEVDLENAINGNHQLMHPSPIPTESKKFFEYLMAGKKYDSIILKLYPKYYLKQTIKRILFPIIRK